MFTETKPNAMVRWARAALLASTLPASAALITASFADDPPADSAEQPAGEQPASEASPVGLKGILPASTPVNILEALTTLPETWKPWADAVAVDLSNLYENLPNDRPGQAAILSKLQTRLGTVTKTLGDSRYAPIHSELAALKGLLKRRLDLAAAAASTLSDGPRLQANRVAAARTQLASAASGVERMLGQYSADRGWKKYLDVASIRQLTSGPTPASGDTGVEAANAVFTRLKGKGDIPDAAVRKFLDQPEIAAYESALSTYISAVNAASYDESAYRQSLAGLFAAVEEYEAEPGTSTAGVVRDALADMRKTAPDGGDKVAAALRDGYLNYNMRVLASESFLNRLVGQQRTDSGGVVDFILGANVSGNQVTNSTIGLDLIPNGANAQFDITLNGISSSNTAGSTSQAVIYTQGTQWFDARKRVIFDGNRFSTQQATINVSANNVNTGAQTSYSGGLFGRFAENIALREAERSRGEAEAIAASRVRDRVLPSFNTEVDREFGQSGSVNDRLKSQLLQPLQEANLLPEVRNAYTTSGELILNSRLMNPAEVGGSEPPAVPSRGLSLQVHESTLNNGAARMGLAGRTLSEDELRNELQSMLKRLLGPNFSLSDSPMGESAGPNALVFAADDPIRFKAANGELALYLKTGFKQADGDDIPTQEIRVPIKFSIEKGKVVAERGDLSISPVEKPANVAQQLTFGSAIRKKLETALPRREFEQKVKIPGSKLTAVVSITSIRMIDGWVVVTLE
jgi:hypothetical protein